MTTTETRILLDEDDVWLSRQERRMPPIGALLTPQAVEALFGWRLMDQISRDRQLPATVYLALPPAMPIAFIEPPYPGDPTPPQAAFRCRPDLRRHRDGASPLWERFQ